MKNLILLTLTLLCAQSAVAQETGYLKVPIRIPAPMAREGVKGGQCDDTNKNIQGKCNPQEVAYSQSSLDPEESLKFFQNIKFGVSNVQRDLAPDSDVNMDGLSFKIESFLFGDKELSEEIDYEGPYGMRGMVLPFQVIMEVYGSNGPDNSQQISLNKLSLGKLRKLAIAASRAEYAIDAKYPFIGIGFTMLDFVYKKIDHQINTVDFEYGGGDLFIRPLGYSESTKNSPIKIALSGHVGFGYNSLGNLDPNRETKAVAAYDKSLSNGEWTKNTTDTYHVGPSSIRSLVRGMRKSVEGEAILANLFHFRSSLKKNNSWNDYDHNATQMNLRSEEHTISVQRAIKKFDVELFATLKKDRMNFTDYRLRPDVDGSNSGDGKIYVKTPFEVRTNRSVYMGVNISFNR